MLFTNALIDIVYKYIHISVYCIGILYFMLFTNALIDIVYMYIGILYYFFVSIFYILHAKYCAIYLCYYFNSIFRLPSDGHRMRWRNFWMVKMGQRN
jgi:hypothetical protein